ncbi:hypothetical protein FSP39_023246 [Pinctada imbricata]|uniref:Helix-turn-helix domain-containing protein n=2 Tax=Pinctada imbricata TaxID=66713 RepID=A0AA88YND6_PINIB|nr:hypothetical protein FSP39_023246 [Pinctada imbricata]
MARRFNRKKKENKCRLRSLNKSALKQRKQRGVVANAKKFVLNLSIYTLSNNEYLLLGKGLKYIPTPSNVNVQRQILKDFDEFSRKLRCKYMFENKDKPVIHPFRTNTGFKPGPTCNALENYIHKTKLELSSIPLKERQENLSISERNALASLKNNPDIVIKKADKSNTVVVMDKCKYIKEGLRQLQSKHYIEVERPNLMNIQNVIQEKLTEMHSNGYLDKETFRFLNDSKNIPRCGQLYLLPKIHKIKGTVLNALNDGLCSLKDLPPGRPIISQCATPTYKIGAYCDHFLLPIVKKQLTYIKDTTDFIVKLESLRPPPEVLFVTYDITSMYTNMEFDELITAVKEAYQNADKPVADIPYPKVSDFVFLIKTILENNYFEFNGKYYKQTIGCAMGSTVSPEVSDIRMYQITHMIMNQFEHANKVLFHGRYRDDGFMIFNGTRDEILKFFEIGNSCHRYLKFTYEISGETANFLDTTVYKGRLFQTEGKLDIKSYIKPTNNFQYLQRNSAHCQSVFKGFIKGECIRHLRNTNDKQILEIILDDFRMHLLNRGYSETEINPIITETKLLARSKALEKQRNKRAIPTPLVMVTKYNPCVKGLKRRLLKYWKDLKSDSDCNQIFDSEPMVAYSKHKNIGDLIIRARLQ